MTLCKTRTVWHVTRTCEGDIPHKLHPQLRILMPVLLDFAASRRRERRVKEMVQLMPPRRDELGQLIYVMPGGRRYHEPIDPPPRRIVSHET